MHKRFWTLSVWNIPCIIFTNMQAKTSGIEMVIQLLQGQKKNNNNFKKCSLIACNISQPGITKGVNLGPWM